MLNITQFILNKAVQQLSVLLESNTGKEHKITEKWDFSFEFLRVVSPNGYGAKQAIYSHKKGVILVRIEAVAKHGYRFIFDDDFQIIYNQSELNFLHQHKTKLWQDYLRALTTTGHNREASISIKQL